MRSEVGQTVMCPMWMVRDRTISAEAIRFWLFLKGEYADKRIESPSRAEIAADMDVSIASIDRWIRTLVEFGGLRVIHVVTKNGVKQPNDYELLEVRGGQYPPVHGVDAQIRPSETAISLLEGVPAVSGAPTFIKTTVTKKVLLKEAKYVRFDAWWSRYPRKVRKGAAKRAWLKMRVERDEMLYRRIMDGLHRYHRIWETERTAQKFIPHPSTWLNERRFEDEVEPDHRDALSRQTRSIVDASEQFLSRHAKKGLNE